MSTVPVTGGRLSTVVGEAGKVPAFLRRDFLEAWSYRAAFFSDAVNMALQALLFYYIGQIVDPGTLPTFGGGEITYFEFVVVGIAVARALLTSPPVLLIDEATHDLDPEAARRVRELVAAAASHGAAVAWVTQRLDEIRGFADVVTLLHAGRVQFAGTVPQLISHAAPRRYLLHLDAGGRDPRAVAPLQAALASTATLAHIGEERSEHYVLVLAEGVILGDALAALATAGVRVLSCREERSEIEEAFLLLVEESGA